MIVSVSGLIGSGKDTIASYLIHHHGFRKMSFAGALKDSVSVVMGWDRELLEGTTKCSREWRDQVDVWWANRLNMPQLTPRWVLQHWGTEIFRTHVHEDIWVASLENKLRMCPDNVVITDARFANEITAVKNAGGTTIRVSRGPDPDWFDIAKQYNKGQVHNFNWANSRHRLEKLKIHPSEYSSVGLAYDFEIDNNGTIDDLHHRVDDALSLVVDRPSATLPDAA